MDVRGGRRAAVAVRGRTAGDPRARGGQLATVRVELAGGGGGEPTEPGAAVRPGSETERDRDRCCAVQEPELGTRLPHTTRPARSERGGARCATMRGPSAIGAARGRAASGRRAAVRARGGAPVPSPPSAVVRPGIASGACSAPGCGGPARARARGRVVAAAVVARVVGGVDVPQVAQLGAPEVGAAAVRRDVEHDHALSPR